MKNWRHVDTLVLLIFGMVAGIKLMPMTLTQNAKRMSLRVLGAALFQISDRFCLADPVKTTSPSKGRVPRAKVRLCSKLTAYYLCQVFFILYIIELLLFLTIFERF